MARTDSTHLRKRLDDLGGAAALAPRLLLELEVERAELAGLVHDEVVPQVRVGDGVVREDAAEGERGALLVLGGHVVEDDIDELGGQVGEGRGEVGRVGR
jgi:hypothetical protein